MPGAAPLNRRDLIVIGGSAGSVPALRKIVGHLPSELPAAVLVVVHQAQSTPGMLPLLLNEAGPLSATHAVDGEMIEPGHVYVAPPDRHLLVEPARAGDSRLWIRLSLGPKENRFRPAIDPMFRTAARAGGGRTIGVVLSGLLDDGSLGLIRIKQRGGVAIVQDPLDADCSDMPASAIRHARVDHICKANEIADVLTRLVREPMPEAPTDEVYGGSAMSDSNDQDTKQGAGDVIDVTERGDHGLTRGTMPGVASGLTCPQCGGSVWEMQDDLLHYRCHVGHRYTADSMAAEQESVLESTLWAAMRMFEENASLHRRMAKKAASSNLPDMAARFNERARESERSTEVIRRLLLGEGGAPQHRPMVT
jgi:two-component system chemotaxis response regulator CheB